MRRGLVIGCGGTLGAACTVGALAVVEERLAAQRGETGARAALVRHLASAPHRFPPVPRARLGSPRLVARPEGFREPETPQKAPGGGDAGAAAGDAGDHAADLPGSVSCGQLEGRPMKRRYPKIEPRDAVVVVTGAGRGIGRATATLFARVGARVSLGDLDGPSAEAAAETIGARAKGHVVDVTSRQSFAAFVDEVLAEHGRIDVLVNNAGVMPLGGFLDEPDALSRTTLEVNVWGLIHGMRLVLPGMIARGRGHVVNIASMAGKIAIPGMAVYNASKFAAVGLTAAVRREVAGTGVSVSAVLPSAVRTELASGAPLGRGMPTVDPEVVARAVVSSCRTRKAEIPVPAFLAGWDILAAVTPEPVMRAGRRLLGDDRALTSVDHLARAAYEQRVADQSLARQVVVEEQA